MTRLSPKLETLRALFAHSGNQCAFPGCTQLLINHQNKFVGQICHIEAAKKGGERFNPNSSDEERRSYENLLILCYPHHIETNDVSDYSVDLLKKCKAEHESKFKHSNFIVSEEELLKLSREMETYWNNIDFLNKIAHNFLDSGLEMEVNGNRKFQEVTKDIYESIKGIKNLLDCCEQSDNNLIDDLYKLVETKKIDKTIIKDIPYYENPFINRNWEIHNLGKQNWFKRLEIDLLHFEIIFYQEYLKLNNDDEPTKRRFNKLKKEFEDLAQNATHID